MDAGDILPTAARERVAPVADFDDDFDAGVVRDDFLGVVVAVFAVVAECLRVVFFLTAADFFVMVRVW